MAAVGTPYEHELLVAVVVHLLRVALKLELSPDPRNNLEVLQTYRFRAVDRSWCDVLAKEEGRLMKVVNRSMGASDAMRGQGEKSVPYLNMIFLSIRWNVRTGVEAFRKFQ